MVQILREGKIIINFDETKLEGCRPVSNSWVVPGMRRARHYGDAITGVSLLLAITSDGRKYFQFLQGNNNEVSVANFIILLV